ncbi:hypothetical protein BJ964_008948 [Actinoplanes lobatus]|uniref:Uncharacterized protein n=1 Tax=Actinoplanes lobatus TaxID=113568 RepID=A0A7W7MLE9_9ACTN|nr:hypothetical protein [Actinoplanes lobatus]
MPGAEEQEHQQAGEHDRDRPAERPGWPDTIWLERRPAR